MQLLISTFMILAYTIYFCIHAKTNKEFVNPALGKCISMSLGMVSSTMIGLILALFLPGELAYTTVLSIVVSNIVAYFIGVPFGVTGIMEAMAASLMGAMMGTMLGEMIPESRQTFMIIAMDLIYLVAVISFIYMMNKATVKGERMKVTKVVQLFLSLILFLSMIGFAATLEAGIQDVNKKPEMDMEHNHH